MTTEATEKKTSKKRKPRPRPTNALAFSVWTENGAPLPESAVRQIEEAFQRVQFELFNEGIRLLSQTTRA